MKGNLQELNEKTTWGVTHLTVSSHAHHVRKLMKKAASLQEELIIKLLT